MNKYNKKRIISTIIVALLLSQSIGFASQAFATDNPNDITQVNEQISEDELLKLNKEEVQQEKENLESQQQNNQNETEENKQEESAQDTENTVKEDNNQNKEKEEVSQNKENAENIVIQDNELNQNNTLSDLEQQDVKTQFDVAEKENVSYLSDRDPSGYNSRSIKKDVDQNNNTISLLDENNREVTYQKGYATHAYSSIFYNDIQENGYKRFVADVGISKSARSQTNANYTEVTFKVLVDGVEKFNSGVMNGQTPLKHIDVDVSDAEVVQLLVMDNGNNSYDHAVWADAGFIKENKNSPWLEVNPLEFNLPSQVTRSNILEYADAKDYKGNDIEKNIEYTTNYVQGQTGEFTVTYTVTDAEGNKRTRTVPMKVTGEDYTQRLSLERLKQPWASHLYHGRGTLPRQGQKAWDLILPQILNFDKTKWTRTNHWGTDVYAVKVNLQENGIYATKAEVAKLQTMMSDDEPRVFIIPDWENEVTTKDGMAEFVTIYVRVNLAEQQDSLLQKIEDNTQKMLEEVRHDMTEAQKVFYVLKKYSSWLKYGGGGQLLHEALANQLAVCGGNARGTVYLTSRLGVKSVFGRSNSHAWSYSKLNDEDAWYKNDLLAGPAILVDADSSKHNLQVGGDYRQRHYEWFDFSKSDYSREKLKYPPVWLNLTNDEVMLLKNQSYNLRDYIGSFGSVENSSLTKDNIKITVNAIDEQGNFYAGADNFSVENDGSNLKGGTYLVRYTLVDGENVATKTLKVYVPSGKSDKKFFEDKDSHTGNMVKVNSVGLYTGSEEKYYKNALASNEAGSITYDISGNDYKYVTMDFGIKDSVRQNSQWGSNGKVKLEVIVDGEKLFTSKVLGWYDAYQSIKVELPKGAKKVKLNVIPVGSGNNHAAIGNLSFTQDTNEKENLPNYLNGFAKSGSVQQNVRTSLFDGKEEKTYNNAIDMYEHSQFSVDVTGKNYKYLAFDYGIKGSVRENTNWGYYGKVQVQVLADDQVIYTGSVKGWKDKYDDIKVEIPRNTKKITVKNIAKGSGNNHAGIGNFRFLDKIGLDDSTGDYISKVYQTGNMTEVKTVALYDGTQEKQYKNALISQEYGSMTFDIQNKGYSNLSLDFGIKDSVRQNTQWGYYGKVQLQILVDGKPYYSSKVMGWKTPFEHINLQIPKGARTITLKNIPKGSGNNHAAIGNLRFVK